MIRKQRIPTNDSRKDYSIRNTLVVDVIVLLTETEKDLKNILRELETHSKQGKARHKNEYRKIKINKYAYYNRI